MFLKMLVANSMPLSPSSSAMILKREGNIMAMRYMIFEGVTSFLIIAISMSLVIRSESITAAFEMKFPRPLRWYRDFY